MEKYLMIGLGGAIGAILRVAMSSVLPSVVLAIPFQILFVNILGCLLFGFLAEIIALYWSVSVNIKYLIFSGFLGGFTTFSSFAFETILLIEKHQYSSAIIYIILSVALSISSLFLGMKVIRIFS